MINPPLSCKKKPLPFLKNTWNYPCITSEHYQSPTPFILNTHLKYHWYPFSVKTFTYLSSYTPIESPLYLSIYTTFYLPSKHRFSMLVVFMKKDYLLVLLVAVAFDCLKLLWMGFDKVNTTLKKWAWTNALPLLIRGYSRSLTLGVNAWVWCKCRSCINRIVSFSCVGGRTGWKMGYK